MTKQAKRVLISILFLRIESHAVTLIQLRWQLLSRCAAAIPAARKTGNLPSVRQGYLARLGHVRTVLGPPALDRDLIAFLNGIPCPTCAEQMVGAAEFKIP